MALAPADQKLVEKLRKEIERAEKPHKDRVRRYQKCDDVYNAVLKASDSKWRHDLHPPFAMQMIETVVSAIVEEPSEPVVKPLTPNDIKVAPKWELLLKQQRDTAHFQERWPLFVRGGLVRGIAIGKVPWWQEWRETTKRNFEAVLGKNEYREIEPTTERTLAIDQPTFLPLDARDVWWNPDATSPEDIDRVYFRTYETMASLKAAEKTKDNPEGFYTNLAEITNTSNDQYPQSNDEGTNDKDEVLRSGPIEIIERWTTDRLVVIADQKVIIRDESNPFGHGMLPFVFAAPIPRNGHVVGKALPELIADGQLALWSLMNQQLDNTEIMCNSTIFVPQATTEMMDELGDTFPGRKIPVDNVSQMPQWDRPNTSIIEPAIAARQEILQWMKDATGAVDYVSGAGEGSVDNQTATEVTLMQSGAQRRLMSFKQQFANADNRIGQQQIELCKRLMTKPELIANLSAGSYEHEAIEPYEIANSRCIYQVADVSESMNQQTRRMEATLKLQTLAGLAPLMPGEINLREAVEDFSEAYGDDREAFLNAPAPSVPPMLPGLAPGGNMGLGQAAPPTPPVGAGGVAPPPTPYNGVAA